MITEDHQTQVVHIVDAILLYVHTVLHSNNQPDMTLHFTNDYLGSSFITRLQ